MFCKLCFVTCHREQQLQAACHLLTEAVSQQDRLTGPSASTPATSSSRTDTDIFALRPWRVSLNAAHGSSTPIYMHLVTDYYHCQRQCPMKVVLNILMLALDLALTLPGVSA